MESPEFLSILAGVLLTIWIVCEWHNRDDWWNFS